MDVIVILIGLVFGSFYNVVAYRVPRGESIVAPPSHCPQCGHRLGAVELVPVLSFLWQRGRCRHCGARISWRYPLAEGATGALFWATYRAFGLSLATPASWLVGSAVLLAALRLWDRRPVALRRREHAADPASPLHDESGLTLLEVLAALAILGIVTVAAMGLYTVSARAQKQAEATAGATNLGQSVMEGLHYTASFGALAFMPPGLQHFAVERDGVTYQVQLSVEPDPDSPTLWRVGVHVAWDQPSSSSVDLMTLLSESGAAGSAGGKGNQGDPGDGGGNGNDKPPNGDKDNGNDKPPKDNGGGNGGPGEGGEGRDEGGQPASPDPDQAWGWLYSLVAQ